MNLVKNWNVSKHQNDGSLKKILNKNSITCKAVTCLYKALKNHHFSLRTLNGR